MARTTSVVRLSARPAEYLVVLIRLAARRTSKDACRKEGSRERVTAESKQMARVVSMGADVHDPIGGFAVANRPIHTPAAGRKSRDSSSATRTSVDPYVEREPHPAFVQASRPGLRPSRAADRHASTEPDVAATPCHRSSPRDSASCFRIAAGTGSVITKYCSRGLKWRRSGLNSAVAIPVHTMTVRARTSPPSTATSTCLAPARTFVTRDRSKKRAPRDFAAAAIPRHARYGSSVKDAPRRTPPAASSAVALLTFAGDNHCRRDRRRARLEFPPQRFPVVTRRDRRCGRRGRDRTEIFRRRMSAAASSDARRQLSKIRRAVRRP